VADRGSRFYAEGEESGGYNTEFHVEEMDVVGFAEANREVIAVFYTSNGHKGLRVSWSCVSCTVDPVILVGRC
jgi:hypothetical protein